jgi:hypothetical protein
MEKVGKLAAAPALQVLAARMGKIARRDAVSPLRRLFSASLEVVRVQLGMERAGKLAAAPAHDLLADNMVQTATKDAVSQLTRLLRTPTNLIFLQMVQSSVLMWKSSEWAPLMDTKHFPNQ